MTKETFLRETARKYRASSDLGFDECLRLAVSAIVKEARQNGLSVRGNEIIHELLKPTT